ncbi:DUF1491 family protein [Paracoccus sp. p4-l81]|uniref:DUF1491 family protein n=1 Tax=Paracoccus sp. p4-l81 TaxID=3342806 RepID=UPI0035BB4BCF
MATEARLAANLWVAAYLARLQAALIPAYVTRRGDGTSGAVVVKVAHLDGTATAHVRRYDFATDSRQWEVLTDGPEAQVDAVLAREAAADPDLWLIEIESKNGRTLLDEDGLR